jgi:hypothetical protein
LRIRATAHRNDQHCGLTGLQETEKIMVPLIGHRASAIDRR